MAEIILKFNSDEEYEDARAAMDGINWKKSMFDLDYKLRQTTKYDLSALHEGHATEIESKVAEKYRQILREILEHYSLHMEM
jgi:hypothetical protein